MFAESERQIFRISLAGQQLAYDPLAVKRKLIEYGVANSVDFVADFILLDTEAAVESGALSRIIKAFRDGFKLPEFEFVDGKDSGYIDADVLKLAESWADFITGLKKNTVTLRTSPTPTECLDESTTKRTSE